MNQQDGTAYLVAVLKDRLIDKELADDGVPAAIGVEGTGMIPDTIRTHHDHEEYFPDNSVSIQFP